jgi:hypothetical protein
LDLVEDDNGAIYAYQQGGGSTPTMTAEGLLCRMYLGWQRQDRHSTQVSVALIHPYDPHKRTFVWALRGGTRGPTFLGQKNNVARDQLTLDVI